MRIAHSEAIYYLASYLIVVILVRWQNFFFEGSNLIGAVASFSYDVMKKLWGEKKNIFP